MNRTKFAHSWGRKLFFGFSWPVSVLLGLLYLQSFIIPASVSDWFYFIGTTIGHYGLLNAVVYFLLFCPVVAVMSGYYTARLWSLLLIVALNLFIVIDAICFSTYHLHIYSYIFDIFVTEGWHNLISSEILQILIGILTLIFALFIWIRGEIIWRRMQTRFSNPVKSWYLVLIMALIIIGKLMIVQGKVSRDLLSLFPLDVNYIGDTSDTTVNQKFYYPKEKLSCKGKNNPNIVLITVKDWRKEQITEEAMPNIFHLQMHGTYFTSHINPSLDKESGVFSLLYSLPNSYQDVARKRKSAFYTELETRNYNIYETKSLEAFSPDLEKPFYLTLNFNAYEADAAINEVILALQKNDLLSSTHILLVGLESTNIPFMYFPPARKAEVVDKITTQYDVIPSLMENIWQCNNVFKAASVGRPLKEKHDDWYLMAGEDRFRIIDVKNEGWIEVNKGRVSFEGRPRKELLFSALREMNRFFKP